jgi:hypothetical protein
VSLGTDYTCACDLPYSGQVVWGTMLGWGAGEGELRRASKLLQVDINWWAMVYDIQNSEL